MKPPSPACGMLLAILAAVLFSSKTIAVKMLYPMGLDPLTILTLRMSLAAPVLPVCSMSMPASSGSCSSAIRVSFY